MTLMFYWTDILIWIFFGVSILFCWQKWSSPLMQDVRHTLVQQPRYIVSLLIVTCFIIIGLLDSLHFKLNADSVRVTRSALDILLSPRDYEREKTYSAPFALTSFTADFERNEQGVIEESFPNLKYSGAGLKDKQQEVKDIFKRIGLGILYGCAVFLCIYVFLYSRIKTRMPVKTAGAFWITLFIILATIAISAMLMFEYHILGTDKVGRDVFYIALKSIRTGLVIGTVTSFVMLPFALGLGIWAGYFRGMVDSIIQYLYTTLGSIPGVLLIAAAVLSFQVKIEEDPDLKLLLLCVVLGATGWIGLCRLLRGETLKLREADYVMAATALGVRNIKIIFKHILPNLMHIVIITVVLDFSGLVLAESILSYVGVGVAPTTHSWGNMINAARLEMAMEPMVWWSLFSAFLFMFTLVFSANILGDAITQALNPRER